MEIYTNIIKYIEKYRKLLKHIENMEICVNMKKCSTGHENVADLPHWSSGNAGALVPWFLYD